MKKNEPGNSAVLTFSSRTWIDQEQLLHDLVLDLLDNNRSDDARLLKNVIDLGSLIEETVYHHEAAVIIRSD